VVEIILSCYILGIYQVYICHAHTRNIGKTWYILVYQVTDTESYRDLQQNYGAYNINGSNSTSEPMQIDLAYFFSDIFLKSFKIINIIKHNIVLNL
jgi:hypothetical protein